MLHMYVRMVKRLDNWSLVVIVVEEEKVKIIIS